MIDTRMTNLQPTKVNTTLRMTQYATSRLVKLAGEMGFSKSVYVEHLIRQTQLDEHIGAEIGVPLVDGEDLHMYKINANK